MSFPLDLLFSRSAHDGVVPARGKALVPTDLSIAIPMGTYARVAPRSGLAWKNFIDTGAGVREAHRLPVPFTLTLLSSVRALRPALAFRR